MYRAKTLYLTQNQLIVRERERERERAILQYKRKSPLLSFIAERERERERAKDRKKERRKEKDEWKSNRDAERGKDKDGNIGAKSYEGNVIKNFLRAY